MTVKVKMKGSVSGNNSRYQMAQDFRNFTRKELAKECRRYFDIANKRITRLEQSNLLSPALHAVMDSGGKFYARGADLKQLQHEYARVIKFLNMQTATVTGARQHEKRIEEKLGHKLTSAQRSMLFEAYRAIEKASPAGVQAYGSDRLVQYLADEIHSEDANMAPSASDPDFEAMIEKAIGDVLDEYERVVDEFTAEFQDMFSF